MKTVEWLKSQRQSLIETLAKLDENQSEHAVEIANAAHEHRMYINRQISCLMAEPTEGDALAQTSGPRA